MNMILVLLLSVLSAVHWSHGQVLVEEQVIVPHHVQPLGGWLKVSPKEESIQKVARKAVEILNMRFKSKKLSELVDITSAQVQVTNNINYKIEAIVGKTKCQQSETVDLESCKMSGKQRKCRFLVVFNPRVNKYTLKTKSCKKINN